jgi:hypothetical protein
MEKIPETTTYFYGKVSEAVQRLAVGAEDIKDRLIGAGQVLLCVMPEDVPEELREDVKWVRDQLTRFPAIGSEGAFRATMRRIRKTTGVKIAKRILYIHARLQDYVEHP